MQFISEYLWPKYASEHWLTQINAEYDGCVVCQEDLPVTGISHESFFAITPASDSWDSWTQPGLAEQRWTKLGHIPRWDGNLSYSRTELRFCDSQTPQRRDLMQKTPNCSTFSWREGQQKHVWVAGKRAEHKAQGCIPVKEPGTCASLFLSGFSPFFHSIFCSLHSPTPKLIKLKWHHSSCCFSSATATNLFY